MRIQGTACLLKRAGPENTREEGPAPQQPAPVKVPAEYKHYQYSLNSAPMP